jgi:hypothetical protein
MNIIWKNYRIYRADDRNIVVERTDTVTATRDMYAPGGSVIAKTGETYIKTTHHGFFGTVLHAAQAILDDYPTHTPCRDIKSLQRTIIAAKKELTAVFQLQP